MKTLKGRPLKKSDVVNYKNYDNEFYKKLWLLNGLHLQLAYFAKSNNINFIHEILDKDTRSCIRKKNSFSIKHCI